MSTAPRRFALLALGSFAASALACSPLSAQVLQPTRGPTSAMRQAVTYDMEGRFVEARRLFQAAIDSAADPAAKAAAQRAMAMSYAFAGDCPNTLRYEQQVIDYWKTREQAEPQNAFYQEGEMADEGARVCIDVGDMAAAERWYRLGYSLGMREPAPRTHPASLWDFRLAHALARIAARRGDRARAAAQVAAARRALDSDSAMARQQERFFPQLVGYVAYYSGDYARARTELERAASLRGNERDPFLVTLLAMTEEKLGDKAKADTFYQQAYDLATAHNPPSAYARRVARGKLNLMEPR